MRPGTRKPAVLVQTAGHVAGAAHFYQKGQVTNSPWPEGQVSKAPISSSQTSAEILVCTVNIWGFPSSQILRMVCSQGRDDLQGRSHPRHGISRTDRHPPSNSLVKLTSTLGNFPSILYIYINVSLGSRENYQFVDALQFPLERLEFSRRGRAGGAVL